MLHHTIKQFHEAMLIHQKRLENLHLAAAESDTEIPDNEKILKTQESISDLEKELKSVIGEIKVCEDKLAAIESLTPKESKDAMDGFRN